MVESSWTENVLERSRNEDGTQTERRRKLNDNALDRLFTAGLLVKHQHILYVYYEN